MWDQIEIIEKQEELLQFDKFNAEDAYELGTFMVDYARKRGIVIAVSIQMCNGSVVFQYLPEGIGLLNQKWMERKFNTVKLTEMSSLRTTMKWENAGESVEMHALEKKDYALCGGGFPIRIKGSKKILGGIMASNLFHIADHEFIIDCLREFLDCREAPRYPYDDK